MSAETNLGYIVSSSSTWSRLEPMCYEIKTNKKAVLHSII